MVPDVTHIELRFQPTVDLISRTRKFVCSYYEPVLSDQDLLSRIGLATHELLENIVKYALDGEATTRLELVVDGEARRVAIQTTSRISPEQRPVLEAVFAEMNSAPDAFTYYQAVMGKACHRRDGSGLGLARVWAEAEMTVTHAFVGDAVTITAVAMLPLEDES